MENSHTASEKRRRRPPLACIACRRRKVRCDRKLPCQNCVRARRATSCAYVPDERVDPKDGTHGVEDGVNGRDKYHDQVVSAPYLSPAVSTSHNSASVASPEQLAERVRQLEQQLDQILDARNGRGTSKFPRLMMSLKTLHSEKNSEAYLAMSACKALGRQIKATRVPTTLSSEFGKHMPSKELADELLESYFRTFETVYRVLHVPSFRSEYRRYWQNPTGAREAFVIQLQLCLAIGAVLHDDTYSLRNLSMQWIYDARLWLLQPSEKSRLNVTGLQVWCLIHLARDICGVGGDLVWASAGTMMRMALYIGLHRDPIHLPKMPLLAAETRRRVWATILEILVQSSMDSGGPPLITTNDYDTKPPGNYNDDDLLRDTTLFETPPPKPNITFTDTSIQIALLKSIKTRLEIAAYLNEFHSVTNYDKSLLLNSGLTTASRSLDALLRVYQSQQPGPSTFQLCAVEQMIRRYFLALHLPWLGSAREDPRYYFSRKLCVDIGLRYHRQAETHGYVGTAADGDDGNGTSGFRAPDDFGRLLICGSGGFRYIGTQCLLMATLELLWELEERMEGTRSLGLAGLEGASSGGGGLGGHAPAAAPPLTATTPGMGIGLVGSGVFQDGDMLDILRHSSSWMRARIRAGEVNIKGYLFTRAMLAEAEGLARGASEEEVEQNVKLMSVEASKDSLNLLKEMYAGLGNGDIVEGGSNVNTGDIRPPRYTGMDGTQIPIDGVEEDFAAMDTDSGGQMSSDWDWDFDHSINFNFNLNLGGMDLVFGDPSMY